RWRCVKCKRSCSDATFSTCFKQHKRRVNASLYKFSCSGVSQRRAARILKIHRTTVARKLKFLARLARHSQRKYLAQFKDKPIAYVQFDEMETHEHTKLKPLSIALAVDKERRKILGFQVSSMPAKGLLASLSRRKYGLRADGRKEA